MIMEFFEAMGFIVQFSEQWALALLQTKLRADSGTEVSVGDAQTAWREQRASCVLCLS